MVAKAKEAGFTEPDPRDDLSGTDVARKVNIYLAVTLDLLRWHLHIHPCIKAWLTYQLLAPVCPLLIWDLIFGHRRILTLLLHLGSLFAASNVTWTDALNTNCIVLYKFGAQIH